MPSAAQREPGYYGPRGTVDRGRSGRQALVPPLADSRRVDMREYYSGRQEYYQQRGYYERAHEQDNPRQSHAYIQSHYMAPPPPVDRPSRRHIATPHHQYDVRQFLPQARPTNDCDRYCHLSRSTSLPFRQAPPKIFEPVDRLGNLPNGRKPRPKPLQIPPVVHRPETPEEKLDLSPYSPSILALYSPSQAQSPKSKTRSLPTYQFQASDFLNTEFDTPMLSPWFQLLSPEITSPSASVFSPVPGSASSRSSISSFAHNLSDVNCGPLETPDPQSVGNRRYGTVRDLMPNVSTKDGTQDGK